MQARRRSPADAPQGGKGTQAAKIHRDHGLAHISTGDLLREEVRRQTPLGQKVEQQLKTGALVADSVVLDLVRGAVREPKVRASGWLLDGYPRTRAQAEQLHALLAAEAQPLSACLYLDVPAEVIVARLSARLVHPASGRVYNLEYKPPRVPWRDDDTGEPLVRRPDDEPATIRRRLDAFQAATAPLLDFYRAARLLHAVPSPNSDVGYVAIQKLLAA